MYYELIDNKEAQRYEFHIDGYTPILQYIPSSEVGTAVYLLPHTEVPPALEGHDVGSSLVKQSLDDIRSQNLEIIPTCPFVVAYIRRHPEYEDMVFGDFLSRYED